MNSRITIGLVSMVLTLLMFSACARKTELYETRLDILNTFAQVSISGLDGQQAQEVTGRVAEALGSLDNIGYTFNTAGELQRMNDAFANGRTIAVSDEMIELLVTARDLSLASGGIFNPAAGALTAMWEFHCDREDCGTTPYPDDVQKLVEQKLARLLKRIPTMNDLNIRGNRVSSRNRETRMELGDIIRGFALDKGIDNLKQAGATNAMIDIGGSVHTTGTRGEHAWWIGIPDASGKHMIGSVDTSHGESIFTVRATDTSPGQDDLVYRRIVDPRTGQPAQEVASVTVIHSSATVANAAATALLIAGSKDWKGIADRMGAHAVIMITQDGTIYTSPAIEARIHWKQGITHQHLVP